MCTVCGCGGESADDHHDHGDHHHHRGHDHDHGHGNSHGQDHLHPETRQSPRLIRLERDILAHNNAFAARNRLSFTEKGILALNLVSSPGSGKTTLLCRSAADLKERMPVAVIEGDQQTSFDADRIRAVGVPAVQINTGKGCHLDAQMVGRAAGTLDLAEDSLLFIENVGNLVCPAAFDLGEAAKVVILSVTEGEDKPLKYPDMFAAATLMVLNKVDLLPHLTFDVERCIGYARKINPKIQVLRVSATSGEGLAAWYAWIDERRRTALNDRAALLEAKLATLRHQLKV